MFTLTIEDKHYSGQPGETVLDVLLRENVPAPYLCRQGTCHVCMLRSLDTSPPPEAQNGLKDTQKEQRYFLACQCRPAEDMTIKLPNQPEWYATGTVTVNQLLNRNTLLLVIELPDTFDFKPGQFVNLRRSDGLTRSYSIASLPQEANTLEFHIRRLPSGQFSRWLHEEIAVGDSIEVSEPKGHCFYLPDRKDQGLLLVGTGTGLAPLAGILNDALSHGHSGPIHLFHGSREPEDLYRIDELQALAERHPNFHYIPCVSGDHVPEGFAPGRANEVALASIPSLKGWRVFLCGHPDMVNQMKLKAFLQGASMSDIYTDAFYLSTPAEQS